MAFGKELLIDLYGVSKDKCDSLELNYRFLENLVRVLKMEPFTNAFVFHGGRDKNGNEIYPDKAGVTGFIGLITSSIVIHTINDKGFVSINCYTCGELDENGGDTLKFICDTFQPSKYEIKYIERGNDYGN